MYYSDGLNSHKRSTHHDTLFGFVEAMTLSWYISPTVYPSAIAKWFGISWRMEWPHDQGVLATGQLSFLSPSRAAWFASQPLDPLLLFRQYYENLLRMSLRFHALGSLIPRLPGSSDAKVAGLKPLWGDFQDSGACLRPVWHVESVSTGELIEAARQPFRCSRHNVAHVCGVSSRLSHFVTGIIQPAASVRQNVDQLVTILA